MKGMRVDHYVILALIMVMGIFLRSWDYASTLHFELDQARDMYVVHDAMTTGQWPVYGPMARGSELFLGPLFYYGQIITGKIFGVRPEVIAFAETILSILVLPLVFVLARRTFSLQTAISVTAIVASSAFFVTYGRFAWNPNAMIFWGLLLTYCVVSLSDKQQRYKAICIAGGIGFSASALMQLHFIAFLCVPLTLVIYYAVRMAQGSEYDWRLLVCGVVAFLLPTMPMIAQEVNSSGATTKALYETIRDKGNRDNDHHVIEKIVRSTQKSSTYLLTTMVPSKYAGTTLKTRGKDFICDNGCKVKMPYLVFSLAFLMVGILCAVRLRDCANGNITILMSVWLVIGGVFLTLLAYQISPRFYLFLAPPIIFLWACVVEAGFRRFTYITTIAVLMIVSMNIHGTIIEYRLLKASQTEAIRTGSDNILGRSSRVTLGALRKASDIITSDQMQVNFVIVGDNRYARALHYLVDKEGGDKRLLCYAKRGGLPEVEYAYNEIWLLVREQTRKQIPGALEQSHTVQESYNIGTINLYKLSSKKEGNSAKGDLPQKCHVR